MPAPVFNLPVYGPSGTPYSTEQGLEAAINAALAALWTDLTKDAGKLFGSRQVAVDSGQDNLPASLGRIITMEGTAMVTRGPGQTANDPLFGSYPSWGVITKEDTATVLRDASLLQLTDISGPANFPVARLKPALYDLDAQITLDTYFSIIPILTNTDRVYLTIGSVIASTEVLNNAGQSLRPGDWVAGRSYLLTRRGNHLRIVAGDLTSDEVRDGRVWATATDDLSTLNPPIGTDQIVMGLNGGAKIWRRLVVAPGTPDPAIQVQTLDGIWWQLAEDSLALKADILSAAFRGLKFYASRPDAVTVLTSNPAPASVHRIMVAEGNRLTIRRSIEQYADPLFATPPYWGIEYSIKLDGSAVHPAIIGKAKVLETLDADVGQATGVEINWQVHDTGIGTQGWSVVGFEPTFPVPDGVIGKFLRFRARGPSTNNNWTISDVIGPVAQGDQLASVDISASVDGYGASRTTNPVHHAALQAYQVLRDGVGAAPPGDLYKNYSVDVPTTWLGQVQAPLPTEACELLTTYSPAENVIHPCVVEFFNEFCGYRYVCAITAYPSGPALEDPFVYGSNDRVTWTALGGASQPLAVKPEVTGGYNSDTFVAHDPRTGELIVGYRQYLPRSEGDSSDAASDIVLMCRSTRNGYAWSAPREIMRVPADQQIMLAPTIIYDPETRDWHMWVINRPVMHHWSAPSLYGPWTLDPTTIDISGFVTPHHHEVKWVGNRLVSLMYSRGDGQLFFGVFPEGSRNQITWNMSPVLNPRPSSLYKASFVPVINQVAGTVAFDLWWTTGAAGPAGGTDNGLGRMLQYSRTNAAPVSISAMGSQKFNVASNEIKGLRRMLAADYAALPVKDPSILYLIPE